MLALSPLRSSNNENIDAAGDFSDTFLGDDFLDNIDFSGIFDGLEEVDGSLSPELPVSDFQHNLAEFSEGGEKGTGSQKRDEKRDELRYVTSEVRTSESSRSTKVEPSTATATAEKGSHGKKKGKVDWTPELHRRFVQAVEQLGVDKAVPSRILEIMGIHNLTRHNVASHLQKYRSHRKHLLAREAEAGSWNQRRQIYAAAGALSDSVIKKENMPYISPAVSFLPPFQPQFRPLHVWGHPTVDGSPMVRAMLPTVDGIPLQSPWPPPRPNYIAYWQPHYPGGATEGWGPSAVMSTPHFMPQPWTAMRFASPPAAGVPHPMYRPQYWVSSSQNHPNLESQNSAYPSKESIDAAIEDALSKPWLPLPLGLKPPSTESVLVELQKQGVSNVPPGCNAEGS